MNNQNQYQNEDSKRFLMPLYNRRFDKHLRISMIYRQTKWHYAINKAVNNSVLWEVEKDRILSSEKDITDYLTSKNYRVVKVNMDNPSHVRYVESTQRKYARKTSIQKFYDPKILTKYKLLQKSQYKKQIDLTNSHSEEINELKDTIETMAEDIRVEKSKSSVLETVLGVKELNEKDYEAKIARLQNELENVTNNQHVMQDKYNKLQEKYKNLQQLIETPLFQKLREISSHVAV